MQGIIERERERGREREREKPHTGFAPLEPGERSARPDQVKGQITPICKAINNDIHMYVYRSLGVVSDKIASAKRQPRTNGKYYYYADDDDDYYYYYY